MVLENMNILIVDDDVNSCNTLSKIFIKKGYKAVTAESGLRALEMIEKKTFDVVLMDIKMPVMDGVETFKKMKAIRPDIAVILMTAFSVDDLIADALKEGVYSVVRKPFDIDTVINMMEKARNGALLTVVDDDPNICKTMKNILEKKGYSVTTCATGEEAISLAKDRSQDILFIDMKLPVLNGLEVYAEIKKINPKAIMVLMTAYREEMDEMVKEAIENGAYCCLYKPLDMDEVIKLIDKICKEMHKGG